MQLNPAVKGKTRTISCTINSARQLSQFLADSDAGLNT
jgi:hypothetical protein